jgi:hypothetical protein
LEFREVIERGCPLKFLMTSRGICHMLVIMLGSQPKNIKKFLDLAHVSGYSRPS